MRFARIRRVVGSCASQILECHVQSGSPQLRAELKNSKTASEGSCQVWEVDFPSGTIDALVKFFDGVPIDQVVSNALQLRSLHDFANAYGFDGLGRVLDAHARHELLNKDPLGVFAFAISDDKELELAKKACLKLGEQYELCKTSDPVLQATWDAATIFQDQQEYVACVWREKKPNGKGGASSEAAGQHDAFLLLAQTGLQNMTGGRIFAAVFEACRRVEALFGTNNIACDSTIKSRRIPDAEISILDQSLGRLCWSCVEDELEGESREAYANG